MKRAHHYQGKLSTACKKAIRIENGSRIKELNKDITVRQKVSGVRATLKYRLIGWQLPLTDPL